MMDPLSAVGLAANVAQFIGYGYQLLAKSKEIRTSTASALRENVDAELIAKDLKATLTRLQAATSSPFPPLEDLRTGCITVIDELLETLEDLKVNGKKGKWKSFKAAIKTIRAKEKVEEWRKCISSFREEFNIHIEVYIL
jgi:hypothetical protein